jgi:cation transport regulator ChaB
MLMMPMAKRFVFCATMLGLLVMALSLPHAFAIDESTIKATDQIKKNPAMLEMLKKIELSKKILAEMQEQKKQQDQKSKQIQEIRKDVQNRFANDINRMSKDYEPNSPQNAFSRFIVKKPAELQNIYWSMFSYQQEKIKSAKDTRDKILSDGGSREDAWNAYQKISATKRVKMIELNKNLNIQYAGADLSTQDGFDEKGKLPRYD